MTATTMLYKLTPETPAMPEEAHQPSTNHRTYNAEDNIQEETFTGLVYNLTADETCDEPQDNPG